MRKKIRMYEHIPELTSYTFNEGVRITVYSKAFLEAEDSCTAEGGKWVTIRGTHVCIKKGESPADAFKRTTGKDLDGDAPVADKTPKDINISKADNKTGKDKMNDKKYKPIKVGQQTKPIPERAQTTSTGSNISSIIYSLDEDTSKKDSYFVHTWDQEKIYDHNGKVTKTNKRFIGYKLFSSPEDANAFIKTQQKEITRQANKNIQRLEDDLTRAQFDWKKAPILNLIKQLKGET